MNKAQINLYYAETQEERERLLKTVKESLEVKPVSITKEAKVVGFLDRVWIQGSFVRGEYVITDDEYLKEVEADLGVPTVTVCEEK